MGYILYDQATLPRITQNNSLHDEFYQVVWKFTTYMTKSTVNIFNKYIQRIICATDFPSVGDSPLLTEPPC